MPNSNNNSQNSGQGVKSLFTFFAGAAVGAVAAGAAWYMASECEEQSHSHQNQHQHHYPANHPANRPLATGNDTTDKDLDEKDGTLKVCEICFASFIELKDCGVQIVSTPCGHVYCRDCIVGALTVKPECPHCRSTVHERDLRRLYL